MGPPGIARAVVGERDDVPGLSELFKRLGGIAGDRRVPSFARQTLRQWFAARASGAGTTVPDPTAPARPRVILWPDTFNNYFFPQTGQAAVEVLEAAGFEVMMPDRPLCCGRPLYDFGMLDLAKHQLRQILDALRPAIEDGVPVVGLEPSCVAVFRDELVNLFPNDQDAVRLSQQTFLFGEFFEKKAPDYQPPTISGRAIVHGHCHQKAIVGMSGEAAVLKKLGLDYQVLDNGCCGMAGSFGFEREHYDMSLKVAEHELLPTVREAPKEAFIVANGFSCREQIAQTTDRRAVHLADLMRLALRSPGQVAAQYPERAVLERQHHGAAGVAIAGVAAAAIAGVLWAATRRAD